MEVTRTSERRASDMGCFIPGQAGSLEKGLRPVLRC